MESTTMSLKQIAALTGKNEKTVLRWLQKYDGAFCTEISAKCTIALSTKKHAEFTLKETIAIIRAGGNDTLANLLLANTSTALTTTTDTIQHDIINAITSAVSATIPAIIQQVAVQTAQATAKELQKALPAPADTHNNDMQLRLHDHYTITSWAKFNKINLAFSDYDELSVLLAQLANIYNNGIITAGRDKYNYMYTPKVLQKAFSKYFG